LKGISLPGARRDRVRHARRDHPMVVRGRGRAL